MDVSSPTPATGPLSGVRIVEFAGIGPGPFAAMMLADHGAEVIRIERPGGLTAGLGNPAQTDILLRGRKRMEVDLKAPEGRAVVLDLLANADGLIEGYRPGVMERLGLGPAQVHARARRLVYGRMTGWGQEGPLAHAAGHDITYIALSGALHAIGRAGEAPVVPLNLVGDFGGGAMMLAFGMLAGLLHAQRTGEGQIVDAAMTDGAALLMAMMYTLHGQGLWEDARGANILDGGVPYYDTYETADGRHIALGPIEPGFFAQFLTLVGLAGDPDFDAQNDRALWPRQRDRLRALFLSRTQAEWDALLLGTDACYAPVLSLREAPQHPHNRARATFVESGGITQPAPAPRFSACPPRAPQMADASTQTRELLTQIGYDPARIEALCESGTLR
ncbi:MAG: CoA transferase [Neomegalonema sp.]|nr:CoA transferase [Neomegalonema sp.]